MIEQADQIAGQMLDVVGFDRLRPIGRTVTALVRCDHPDAGLAQCLDLVAPGKRQFRPAMAEYQRRLIGVRPRLVIAHANPVGLGELQRRHLDHVFKLPTRVSAHIPYSAAPLMSACGGAKAASSAANSPGSISHNNSTCGMILAPAMKPKSSWSR